MCMSNAQRDSASKMPAMAELFKAAKRDRGDEEGPCQKPTAATTTPAPAVAAADPAKAAPPRCSRRARRGARKGSAVWCRCSGKGKLIGSAQGCSGKSPTCEWDDAMKQCLPPKAVKQTEFKVGELVIAPPVVPAKSAVDAASAGPAKKPVAKEPVTKEPVVKKPVVMDGSGGRRPPPPTPYKPVAKEPVLQPVLDGSGGRRPPLPTPSKPVAKEPVAQPALDTASGATPKKCALCVYWDHLHGECQRKSGATGSKKMCAFAAACREINKERPRDKKGYCKPYDKVRKRSEEGGGYKKDGQRGRRGLACSLRYGVVFCERQNSH